MKNLIYSAVLFCLVASLPGAFAQAPTITKVEPPNWWIGLPDPTLLIYGENLCGSAAGAPTTFSAAGQGVQIRTTSCSRNGHYAFVSLATASAAPGSVALRATNNSGSASVSYDLKARSAAPNAHAGFSPADVMYLIMPDRFADGDAANDAPAQERALPRGRHGGDLRGIIAHLDYLQSLGITALWLTPVLSNGTMPQSYHGYAATDMYQVDPHLGTLADYQALSAALHARGMKLVYDIVPNHIGLLHPWVQDPPAPEWLHGTAESHLPVHYNFEALADPHAARDSYLNITHGWFVDALPDLNQENPLVTRYLIQNAMWWIETAGIDGLRIDTFPYVGRPFWQQFLGALHQAYPRLTSVGEIFNADPTITSFFAGGAEHQGIDTGLDTPFDFPVYFTLRDVLTHDKPMTALAAVMGEDHLYPHPERLVTFFGNHDTKRFLSETAATPARLQLAFGLIATMRGTPQIYSGDEIAMLGGDDPDNRRDFPGGFPGAEHNAFTQAGRTTEQQAVFSWASGLLHLRAAHPALRSAYQQNVFVDDTAFAYVRSVDAADGCKPGGAEQILVIADKADVPRSVSIATADTRLAGCREFTPLFPADGPPVTRTGDAALSVNLAADGFAVYSVR